MKFLTALALSLSLIAPLSQAATTLKIATLAPDGTGWMKTMRKAADDIKNATEGRVKIKYFPGGVQGSDKSVLRKIQIRQLQGGALSTGALAHLTNVTQLYSQPFTFKNLDEIRAIRPQYDQYIADALQEQGFVMLGLSEGGFAYLMSDSALKSSEDVRAKKVWVPEGDIISQTIFENGQVAPISLPVSDVYTSLQTGLIDTIAANPTSTIALQWHTKLNYATDFPLVFLFGMLVVDDKAFAKISSEDQLIVRRIMAEAFKAMDLQNEKDEMGARAALQQNGMQFVELTAADREAWYKLAEGAVAQLAEKGVYPVELYQQLQQSIAEYRQKQAK